MISRRRPLHTCGVSAIAVAHRAYAATQDLNGPLGSMAKRMDKIVSLTSPIIHAMQYQWLALLCFADDHILVVENMIEKFFPPSKNAFDKIDELVKATETLPEKFDYAVNRFPTIIHQFPFLDWALVHVISVLNVLISTLTYWGSQNTREKEIVVDINCNDHNHNSAIVGKLHHTKEHQIHATEGEKSGDFPPISETQQDRTVNCVNAKPDAMKGTYKDVLEKGTKEDMDSSLKNNTVNQEETEKEGSEDEEDEKDENISKDDPILELFESGWLMNTGTRSRETLSRSGSET